jgi:hypothetical protein
MMTLENNMHEQTQENITHFQHIYQQFFLHQKDVWQQGQRESLLSSLRTIAFFAGEFAGITMDHIYRITLRHQWYEFLEKLVSGLNAAYFDEYIPHHHSVIDQLKDAMRSRNVTHYIRIMRVLNSFHSNRDHPVNWGIDDLLSSQLAELENLVHISVEELRPWVTLFFQPAMITPLSYPERCQLAMFDPRNAKSIIQNFQVAVETNLERDSITIREKEIIIADFDKAFLQLFTMHPINDAFDDYLEDYIFPWLHRRSSDRIFVIQVMEKAFQGHVTQLAIAVTAFLKSTLTECGQSTIPEYFQLLIPERYATVIDQVFEEYCSPQSRLI